MIVLFPQAFFTSAQSPSEGSAVGSASARIDSTRLCRFCGCCSANEDDSPGCIGTIVAGSHDGPEWLSVSRYTKRLADERASHRRTPFDIFFDSIKATVEAFDGR